MLPWFEGAFSHAFIALHPFVAIEGLDPSVCAHGTLILKRTDAPPDVDLIEWIDGEVEQSREGKELTGIAIDEAAIKFGRKVRWREICELADFIDHCALDQALRTSIGGMRKDLEDRTAATRLKSLCREHRLFLPTEGRFEPVMQANLIALLERMGVTEVYVGDEFGEEELLISVAALRGEQPWNDRSDLISWAIQRIYPPDHSVLIWVHWDSFYTAVFATAERLNGSNISELLEGFWCTNETTSYWMIEPQISLVQ